MCPSRPIRCRRGAGPEGTRIRSAGAGIATIDAVITIASLGSACGAWHGGSVALGRRAGKTNLGCPFFPHSIFLVCMPAAPAADGSVAFSGVWRAVSNT